MTGTNMIVQTRGLTKQYGKTIALDKVDLDIPRGSIYGLVGNNGAGKTTFLKILLGQVFATSGQFSLWEAQDEVSQRRNRRRCGAIIEAPGFYPHMTAAQNLEYYRIQRGIPGREKVAEKLEQVGLENVAHKKFKQMSLGMKQRLGLGLALLGEPEFLLLDEPINGLDPAGIIEIRNLLLRLNREKHITILISSHNLPELENMVTDYAFLSRGRVIRQIDAVSLHEQCGTYLEIRVTEPERYAALLERELHVTDYKVMPDGAIRVMQQTQSTAPYGKLAVEQGMDLLGLERREIQLEDYYMHLIGEQEGGEIR
ncbi:MAG: ATP-binding cassette domain-containing protein [Acetatifactor sp.]